MNEKNERQEYLRKIYFAALSAGLCSTQKEFAELLEIDRTGLSSAMNGSERNLTNSLIKKVRMFAEVNGLDGGLPALPKKRRTIEIPEETLELYTALAKSVDRLSSMVERMIPGASDTPKNAE